jgi:hypothetical protein
MAACDLALLVDIGWIQDKLVAVACKEIEIASLVAFAHGRLGRFIGTSPT